MADLSGPAVLARARDEYGGREWPRFRRLTDGKTLQHREARKKKVPAWLRSVCACLVSGRYVGR